MKKDTKVVSLASERKKREESRPCSFTSVDKNGKPLKGTAAFLKVAKENGGIDKFITSIAQDASQTALQNAINANSKKSGWFFLKQKASRREAFFYLLEIFYSNIIF